MSTTEAEIIQHSAETARVWHHEVAVALETDDARYAARALKAVLHALRDRLTVEEGAQFASQLPTLVRGVYYAEWRPGAKRTGRRDLDTFLTEVATGAGMAGETEASLAVAAVARVLREHISAGELDDVLAVLPARLKPLFSAAT